MSAAKQGLRGPKCRETPEISAGKIFATGLDAAETR
jgi:hypothetical protein